MTTTEFRCGSCGTELPPDSRFCNKCGAPITPAATSAMAKTLGFEGHIAWAEAMP